MSKQGKDPDNVRRLHGDKLTKVEPPETWTLKLAIDHGRTQATYFQKADAVTPLVRIVDVLADFADRHGLPAGAAVNSFLAAVDSSVLDAVYYLREKDFASLMDAGHMYGELTEAQAQMKTRDAADYAAEMRWDMHGVTAEVYDGVASPLEAFKKHIQAYGPQTSDKSLYAINHTTANRLWSWGRAVPIQAETQGVAAKDAAPAVPKKVKEKDKSPEWTGQRLLARQNELKKDFKDYAARTASEAKLSVRVANRRISEFKTGGAVANVADQLKAVGTKNKAA